MTWNRLQKKEAEKKYFQELMLFIEKEYLEKEIYPEKKNIFKALELTPFEEVQVVILGQDPYHQKKQAQGLAFSTPKELKNPPSMVNILKEIKNDIGKTMCEDGDLTAWAKQGVLLINTIFTVQQSSPKSHQKKGWEIFSDEIIRTLSKEHSHLIFLLWGAPAIAKSKLIDTTKHTILTAPHPSPLSAYRGFFGSKHFSQTNALLKSLGKKEIVW